jgi:hypothetical protein
LTRDLGTNGKKAVTIVDENLLPSLTLNEKSALLISFEETLSYLDSRRKNKELSVQLKEYLTEHWNDETEETEQIIEEKMEQQMVQISIALHGIFHQPIVLRL